MLKCAGRFIFYAYEYKGSVLKDIYQFSRPRQPAAIKRADCTGRGESEELSRFHWLLPLVGVYVPSLTDAQGAASL